MLFEIEQDTEQQDCHQFVSASDRKSLLENISSINFSKFQSSPYSSDQLMQINGWSLQLTETH